MVKLLEPGSLTSIQDLPRHGLARYGLSEAGAMCPHSLAQANYAAGNPAVLPSLEVTLKAPRLLFQQPARIALSGADFGWRLDGRPLRHGQAIEVRPGNTLQGDFARNGLRGYIAFAGGLAVPRWHGSASTHLQSGLGGRILQRGAEIPLPPLPPPVPRRPLREDFYAPLLINNVKVLRVVEGPHATLFSPEAFSLFTGAIYRVSEKSSRMAVRVEGLALPAPQQALVSCGAWHGAIQILPSGQPQILGCEHPATGGYPILASVIAADWETLGQLRPREEIRFGRVSPDLARQLYQRLHDGWRHLGWPCS
jgi:antagonist of KipI